MKPIQDFDADKIEFDLSLTSRTGPFGSRVKVALTLGYHGRKTKNYACAFDVPEDETHGNHCLPPQTASRVTARAFARANCKDFANKVLDAGSLIDYLAFKLSVESLWPAEYTPPRAVKEALAAMKKDLPKDVATLFLLLYNFPSFFMEISDGSRT